MIWVISEPHVRTSVQTGHTCPLGSESRSLGGPPSNQQWMSVNQGELGPCGKPLRFGGALAKAQCGGVSYLEFNPREASPGLRPRPTSMELPQPPEHGPSDKPCLPVGVLKALSLGTWTDGGLCRHPPQAAASARMFLKGRVPPQAG